MTLVGFGQAGARIVDVFAKYQTAEGEQTYNCLALNSNEGDFKQLFQTMTDKNPSNRPNFFQIRNHPWLKRKIYSQSEIQQAMDLLFSE